MESLWPEPSTVLYMKYKKINKKKNNQGIDFTNISKHPLGNMSMIHVHHRVPLTSFRLRPSVHGENVEI